MSRVVAGGGGGAGRSTALAAALFLTLSGCSSAAPEATTQQQGAVRYRSAPALGSWPAADPESDEIVDDSSEGEGEGEATNAASTQPNGIAGSESGGNGNGGSMAAGTGGVMGMAGTSVVSTAGRTGSGGMAGGSGGMGSGGMGSGGMGSGGATVGGAASTFAFDVVTVDQGGRYAPKNVGAIWIATSSGTFVKTLKVWARVRGRYLTRFNAEAGGSRVDAVTAATLRPFMSHHVTWDLTDVNGKAVTNGAYKVVFEVTDHDGVGKSGEAAFELTGDPATVMPPDQAFFTDMQIVVQ